MTRGTPKPFIVDLLSEFDRKRIRYCHFKSNDMLHLALTGVGDLDLLVDFDDVDPFQAILADRGFFAAIDTLAITTPYVFHYYGLDMDDGQMIHLHVYFQLITGGSIL